MTTIYSRYPAELPLREGAVLLRPPELADRDAILAFAQSLPMHDLLFLRRDITRPEEVDDWIAMVVAEELATVLALRGTRSSATPSSIAATSSGCATSPSCG